MQFLAAREARAKIIAAEGEQKASRSLKVRLTSCGFFVVFLVGRLIPMDKKPQSSKTS
jgi:hypothetical protein